MLKAFLKEKNAYGYIASDNGKAVGFAYGYVLNEPDGQKVYYLHAIDVMEGWQNQGYGTELVRFVHEHSKALGCRKMFLLTHKRNVSACRCYEKAGGICNAASDDIVFASVRQPDSKAAIRSGMTIRNRPSVVATFSNAISLQTITLRRFHTLIGKTRAVYRFTPSIPSYLTPQSRNGSFLMMSYGIPASSSSARNALKKSSEEKGWLNIAKK